MTDTNSSNPSITAVEGNPRVYNHSLIEAIFGGDLDNVDDLLANGADPRSWGQGDFQCKFYEDFSDGQQPDQLQTRTGWRTETDFHGNALGAAIKSGAVFTLKALLKSGVDGEVYVSERISDLPLNMATLRGTFGQVELLLKNGHDPNATGRGHLPPLRLAISEQKLALMRLLVSAGADVHAQALNNIPTALADSVLGGFYDGAEYLLESGVNPNGEPSHIAGGGTHRPLLTAIKIRNYDIACLLLQKGADVNVSDIEGTTPLHQAVGQADIGLVNLLLEWGAFVDQENHLGITPLQLAIEEARPDMVERLWSISKMELASLSASQLRQCWTGVDVLGMEFVETTPRRLYIQTSGGFLTSDHQRRLRGSAIGHDVELLMDRQHKRRVFIVDDSHSHFKPLPHSHTGGKFEWRWWHRGESGKWQPISDRSHSLPTPDLFSRSDEAMGFLEGNLCLRCVDLSNNTDWPLLSTISSNPFAEYERDVAISWLAIRFRVAEDQPSQFLQSRIFIHTLDYVPVPSNLIELLPHFVAKVRDIWETNFVRLQARMRELRLDLLVSKGGDSTLIAALLRDAQLLDYLTQRCTSQMMVLNDFADKYSREESKVMWDLSGLDAYYTPTLKVDTDELQSGRFQFMLLETKDEVRKGIENFVIEIKDMEDWFSKEAKKLTDTCRELIQLEFNLVSIREAQRTTTMNESLKRLSWITFIFLPLIFVASLFGMNVDVLAHNPGWWWYPILAVATLAITLGIWLIVRNQRLMRRTLSIFRISYLELRRARNDLERGQSSHTPLRSEASSSSDQSRSENGIMAKASEMATYMRGSFAGARQLKLKYR